MPIELGDSVVVACIHGGGFQGRLGDIGRIVLSVTPHPDVVESGEILTVRFKDGFEDAFDKTALKKTASQELIDVHQGR